MSLGKDVLILYSFLMEVLQEILLQAYHLPEIFARVLL